MATQVSHSGMIRDFIASGFTQVHADNLSEVHRTIYEKLEEVYEKEGNPGNNILPRIPEIQEVFDHPNVQSALTSLLGPGYTMHPHRHGHLNVPSSRGQNWHKDDYIFDQNVRHHRFR